MVIKNSKTNLKKLVAKTTIVLLLSVLLLSIAIPLYNNIKRRRAVGEEILGLENDIGHLQKKNGELRSLLSYLNSDEFVEEQARINLNLRREGEEVYVVNGREGSATGTAAGPDFYDIRGPDGPKPQDHGNPGRWTKYFFGI